MPTLQLTTGENAWLDQANPTDVQDASAALQVRGLSDYRRSLLLFDLTALPAGATLTAATLQLYRAANSTAAHVAHRCTEAWSGIRATWIKRLTATDWADAGGTYAATPAAAIAAGTGYVSADVLSILQAAIAVDPTILNLLIRSTTEGGVATAACEYAAFGTANPPVLTIEYASPAAAPDDDSPMLALCL